MSLRNQHWISLSGATTTGKVPPRLFVMNGAAMSPQQAGEVAHHYKLLTHKMAVSVIPYMVQERTLADGTRVRLVSSYGKDSVFVWPASGKSADASGARGFIAAATAAFLELGVDFGAQRYTEVYRTMATPPVLMRLNTSNNTWTARIRKYPYGSPTNYSVMDTPDRLSQMGSEWTPDQFFDVAFVQNNNLFISWTANKSGPRKSVVLKTLPVVGAVPIVFPMIDGDDLHLYALSPSWVKHTRAKKTKVDGVYDAAAAVENFMPIASVRAGAACFGYNQASKSVTFFQVNALYAQPNDEYAFLFYWYAVVELKRAAPYVEKLQAASKAGGLPSRQYRIAFDPFEGASRPATTLNYPEEYVAPAGGPVAEIFNRTRSFIRVERVGDTDMNLCLETTTHNGQMMGTDLSISGRTNKTEFINTFTPYDDSYTVGTQKGLAELTHTATISVTFETGTSVADGHYSTSGFSGPYNLGYLWSGLLEQPPYDQSPGVWYGSSTKTLTKNNSTTSARYALGDIELYSLGASLEFTIDTGSATQYSYTLKPPLPGSAIVPPFEHTVAQEYPSSGLYGTFLVYGRSDFTTQTSTVSDASKPYKQTSQISITVRDYIFHDMANEVSICLKGVGECTTNINGGNIASVENASGTSSWVVSVEVEANGETVSIPLIDTSGGPTLSLITKIEAIHQGGNTNPHYMYPYENPAIYAPVCEQGDFRYVAYTTKAEVAAGVPFHFILSLPLAIARRTVSMQEDQPPPLHCYAFTALNLTEAGRAIPSAPLFGELLGRAFHINVSQDANRQWLVDLDIDLNDPAGATPTAYFADCYRI